MAFLILSEKKQNNCHIKIFYNFQKTVAIFLN